MINKINISLLITLVIMLFSCSKARIEKPEIILPIKIKFVPLTNYFANKRKTKETYNIDSLGIHQVVTEFIKIATYRPRLIDPLTQEAPLYPYNLDLLELITTKDILFYNIEPISNNKLIEYRGIFEFNFIKDNRILSVHNFIVINCPYMPENYSNITCNDYKGMIEAYKFKWVNNGSAMNSINHLSWTLFGNEIDFSTTNYTKLNFTSNKYDLTNVGIYIVFFNKNTFTRVQNLESIDLPIGEQAKLVAFGITEEGQLYSFSKDIIIGEEPNYNIDLSTTNDTSLSSMLDSL